MVAFSAFNVTYDIWSVMMTEQVLKKKLKKYNTISDWNRGGKDIPIVTTACSLMH